MTEEELSRMREEARRAYEYDRKREEDQRIYDNIQKYGTLDSRKIEKLKEEEKKDSKAKRNAILTIIGVGLLLYMAVGGIAKCTGASNPLFDGDKDYQYRHTDRTY